MILNRTPLESVCIIPGFQFTILSRVMLGPNLYGVALVTVALKLHAVNDCWADESDEINTVDSAQHSWHTFGGQLSPGI